MLTIFPSFRKIELQNLALTLIFCLFTASGFSEEAEGIEQPVTAKAPPLTLRQCVDRALETAYLIEQREAEGRAAHAGTRIQKAARLPQINFTASESFTKPTNSANFNGQEIVLTPDWAYNLGVQLDQVIYSFGRLSWTIQSAELTEKQTLEQLSAQKNQSALDAIKAYYQVILAIKQKSVAEQSLQAQEAAYKQANQLFHAGVVAKYDVYQSESLKEQAKVNLIEAENKQEIAFLTLKRIIGASRNQPLPLLPPDHIYDWAVDANQGLETALSFRPELRAGRYAIEAADAQYHVAQAQRYPNLRLQSNASLMTPTGLSRNEQWRTLFIFSVPIFTGGANKYTAERAQANVDALKASFRGLEEDLEIQVRSAEMNFLAARAALQSAKSQFQAGEEAVRIARVRYREGLSTQTELQQSEANYVSSGYALASAEVNYQLAGFSWEFAIGKLITEDGKLFSNFVEPLASPQDSNV